MEITIKIVADLAAGIPALESPLARVNVILGANGVGKTRILQRIRDQLGRDANLPIVYFEGGRAITLPEDIGTARTVDEAQSTQEQYKQHLRGSLNARLKRVFRVLSRLTTREKSDHSDAVVRWAESGSLGGCPTRANPPLRRLCGLFLQMFPAIELYLEGNKLRCRKNGTVYAPNALSDGEKQVLISLADVGILSDESSLMIIDEPELNLNPLKAQQLWALLERVRTKSTFIYATHSISFALREGVDKVIVLSQAGGHAVVLDDVRSMDPEEARHFLGAIPAVLYSSASVVVEGTDTSFDNDFFKWLIRDSTVAIVPVGGCAEVKAAAKQQGLWARISSGVRIAGVIDRDYRSPNTLSESGDKSCFVLKYHEAESFLCHPDVAQAIAETLKISALPTNRDTFVEILVEHALASLVPTILRRVIFAGSFAFCPSLERRVMAEADAQSARTLLQTAVSEQASLIPTEAAVVKLFDDELRAIEKAIHARDVEKLLSVFPGKSLIQLIAHRIGLADGSQLLLACSQHLDPNAFPTLRETRMMLRRILGLEET